jgi:Lactate dehydrogenase and related dehydrogenases
MIDVCFYEAFEEEADELRRLLPASVSAMFTDRTVQEFIQESGDETPPARLISIRTQSRIPAQWSSELSGILTRSTGYDHLLAYAASVSVVPAFGYLPLYCHRAVAEQAALLWMALMRRLKSQIEQFSRFHRDGLTGIESEGKTLVVVGVGNIGYEVARIARGLGMQVLGVDLHQNYDDITYVSIDEALPQADVLVCAMDLNSANVGYFDLDKWERIKRGAVFVNISRGELSPSTQLLSALKQGQLGGVGLDTFDHEPVLATALRSGTLPGNDPEAMAAIELSQRPDCICTPHNAFNSREAVLRKSEHSIQQVMHFLDHGRFLWPVPME